jgi:hypothetical protein
MIEIFVLAVAAAFWPLLLVIVVVALRSPHPARLLGWFLAGGLLTAVAEGAAIVFSLQGTKFASGSKPAADPVLGLGAGSLALLAACVLLLTRGRRDPKKHASGKHWSERALESGAPLAFAAGIVLNLFPGLFPYVAMKDIAQLGFGDVTKFVLVVAFYVVMLAFIEVPLVGDLVAHERTAKLALRFNAWMDRNARTLAVIVLAVGGTYLVVRATIRLVA